MLLERDEEKWEPVSARILLYFKGIDHVYDFGSNRSDVIVIEETGESLAASA